ncbi:LURP-one-related/scramblase family protein [Streptacidiphilus fuscans]|uniref:LURP-one-related family protein n=1 Tax=Streptacidiphilus fuscans TaxID=2789292 RepID=A0A931AZK4_9ACTN|nr:LURP-one-related family protein [Streptacidiphilus fuscans]MBF9068339.1 LURP-one-related family protein [Streptacidiphilus fuscans]
MKFLMRERIFGFGDDHWITTEHGEKAFLVDGKALRVRETFELKDHHTGEVVAVIKKKLLSVRDAMVVEQHHGGHLATVKKKLITVFHDKYLAELDGSVGGGEIEIVGNFTDHEFHLERDGRRIAVVSKSWFSVRDHYAIDVADGEDVPLLLSIAVCVEHLDAEEHH